MPPRPYPAPHRAMDAVLLRALAAGRVDGAAFFTGLFRHVPIERLLRFLDGRTRLAENLAIGLRTPVPAMLRTALELPWLRRRP
ncbi:lycopene cyclase [Streptomyces sparsogenes DSM 40356]|uniref:Lycopene cyclase n=1 Tax=Streptomyces sparsogenes DSM 40356 TaxID=1331668 RepID=A0A1R1SDH4_9ACTN|nr:lycopene cyclase [Streptomyces sparsogenes DSM 40356]